MDFYFLAIMCKDQIWQTMFMRDTRHRLRCCVAETEALLNAPYTCIVRSVTKRLKAFILHADAWGIIVYRLHSNLKLAVRVLHGPYT